MTENPIQFNLEERSPFDHTFTIAEDSLEESIRVQLLDGEIPFDLGGYTIVFSLVSDDDASVKISSVAGVAVNLAEGIFEYAWTGTDLDTPGRYTAQFKLTRSARDIYIPNNGTQTLYVEVVAKVN